MKKFVLFVCFTLCFVWVHATTYYSKGSLSPILVGSWNSDRDGVSGSAPANFTTAGDIFVIQNGHSMATGTAAWTLSGTGTKIQIESGGTLTANSGTAGQVIAVPNFQIDNGGTYIHNVNSATTSGNAGDIPGSVSRSFADSSTVEIQKWATGLISGTIPQITYGNLTFRLTTINRMPIIQGTATATLNIHGNLKIQSTGTATNSEIRVASNLVAGAVATLNIGGDLSVIGTSTGSVFNINGATTITASTVNVNVGGNFNWLSGGTSSIKSGASPSVANINFVKTGVQVHTYTATFSLIGNINYNVNSGSILDASANPATNQIAYNASSFTLNSGATLRIGHIGGITLTGTGSAVRSGTRTFSSGANYEYVGTATQSTGNGLPATVNNLTINNPAGVTLTNSATVAGTLNLTSGNLILNGNNLTVDASTGSIAGGSASSYVKTSISGTLKQNVGSSPVTFPVGNTSYNPITLQNIGAATSDQFAAEVYDDVTDNGTTSGTSILTTTSYPLVNHTWNVSQLTTNNPTNITMTTQWNPGEESPAGTFDYRHVYVEHYNGTIWENYLASNTPPATPATAPAATDLSGINVGPFTTTQQGLSTLGAFTVAGTALPLAIKLNDISALNKANKNYIYWSTAAEDMGDYFEIERSNDGRVFNKIGNINSVGSANQYTHIDEAPEEGKNIYRLRMVEKNGGVVYSKSVTAYLSTSGRIGLDVYPNPANSNIIIKRYGKSSTKAALTMYDVTGRQVYATSLEEDTTIVDLNHLSAGIYLLKYSDGMNTQTIRINKL